MSLAFSQISRARATGKTLAALVPRSRIDAVALFYLSVPEAFDVADGYYGF
jgi:hypothetical protein